MLNTCLSHEDLVSAIRDPLVAILVKYYEVDGKKFYEIDDVNATKHLSFHLLKLIKKLVVCSVENSPINTGIVTNEVAPDLIIYAQELMIKFNVEFPGQSIQKGVNTSPLKCLIAKFSIPRIRLKEIIRNVSIASAALGDICDQYDHRQESAFLIERDVITPFLSAAASLTHLFKLDIDKIYARRLEQMIEKYESWNK